MKQQETVEILAPAGSFESLKAAVAAGADAVYIGGSKFGARAFADNLDEQAMLTAIDYVHLHGCRLYLTVNTLFKETELGELFGYLYPYYKRGLDAVIVQDMGVFRYIRKHFPDLPIHASTQMTVTGVYGAKVMARLGADRIVTARELSLEEIKQIHEKVDVEIESFVHGALCYCYSGQCLFSSLIGGRSGNRGRCAQPCRLPYEVKKAGQITGKKEERYIMSLKDLCTLDLIPEMIEAGVYSMKIEGRMKSPRYTAGVVSIYRNYVDLYLKEGKKGYRVDPKDKTLLLDLFDRGGFTSGYYKQHNGKDMVAVKEKPAFREANQKLFDYLDHTYIDTVLQKPVRGCVILEEGNAALLELSSGQVSVSVTGSQVLPAQNQPVTEEKLVKQIKKTGGTPFYFTELEAVIRGNVFMPVQALNDLRRKGLGALEQELLKPYQRMPEIIGGSIGKADMPAAARDRDECEAEQKGCLKLRAALDDPSALSAVLAISEISDIYIESGTWKPRDWKQAVDLCHAVRKGCILALPHIFRTEAEEFFIKYSNELRHAGFDALLIRSMEEAEFLKDKEYNIPMIFDHNLYAWNHLAHIELQEAGADTLTMPLELNSRELEHGFQGDELVAYGYLPMMVTAQCIVKTTDGCNKKPERVAIKDRMGKEFAVKNNCVFCYNTIYNTSPLSLLGQSETVKKLKPGSLRLQFSTETDKEIQKIIRKFADEFLYGNGTVSQSGDFTRGHFKRGVE